MNEDLRKKNDSLKALTIGFFLIAIVIVAIFFKSQVENQKIADENNPDTKKSQEITKKITGTDTETLGSLILTDESTVVIDLRNAEEYRKEHLIDSINIPFDNLQSNISRLEMDKKYVFVDDFENPEIINAAAEEFSASGYQDVTYLIGGFERWRNFYGQTISDGDPLSFTDQSKVSYVDSDELRKIIKDKEDLFIIDVRKNGQFIEGHIEGASNLFLEDIEQQRKTIPFGKKIVLYDNDGLWAFKAAVRLFDSGIFNVYALSDGLDSWKKKGYELVK